LGKDKSEMFLMATNGWLDKIEAVLNRFAIPRLFDYNEFSGITELPQVQHSRIEKPDLNELGQFIQSIASHIKMGDEDELWLRTKAGMPEAIPEDEEGDEQPPVPETGEEEEATDDQAEDLEPETGEEGQDGELAEYLGKALADFAETPDAGGVVSVVADTLEKLRGETEIALSLKQKMPAAAHWLNEEQMLKQVLLPEIEAQALAGASAAASELDSLVNIGLDWLLVNQDALDWAREYTFDLVKGITETTKQGLQTQLSNWIEAGESLPEMFKRLEPIYGKPRAELIGTTEVTRAFAEGNQVAWKQSKVIQKKEWRTAADERVCPICGPLHEEQVPIDEPFSNGEMVPPAHPRCRCWIVPVL